METNSNKSSINIIGGCLFAVLAIMQLFDMVRYGASLWSFLRIAAIVIIAVALFAKMKKPLASVGFAVLAVLMAYITYLNIQQGGYRFAALIDIFRLASNLLVIITYIIAAIMVVILLGAEESRKQFAQKCWFIPAAVYAVAIIFDILYILVYRFLQVGFEDFLIIAGLLFSMLWMAYPDGMAKKTITFADGIVTEVAASEEDGYQGLAVHVLLLLCTCGIWYWIWIYKTTAYLNCVEDEEPRNPATKLLLCMFVPFYSIYWVYKSAQRIDKMANARGIQSDLSAVCLILAIFIGIIPPILMQDKINAIATAKRDQRAF